MNTATLTLPRPLPWQAQVRREARRFNAAAVERRAGKSTMAAELLIEVAVQGHPAAYFTPTYKLLGEAWRSIRTVVQPLIATANASDHRIALVTGGVIEMWTLDGEDAGRSRKYKRVIIDEAGLVPNLSGRWNAAIRPTLADLAGDAWLLGTPKGRNFFWQAYQWGQDPFLPDWASWQLPTTVNPFIPAAEIADMRRDMPQRTFEQEVEAVFLEGEGAVFRRIRDCATEARRDPYESIHIMGVDWGQQHDLTVLSVIDAATGKQVALDRFNQIDWATQRGRLRALAEQWQVALIVAELNSIGSPNVEALQAEGLPVVGFETTASSKPPLIASLALAFERAEIGIIDDPVQIGELEAYERTVSPITGRSRTNAPEGMHDDCVVSLALAWFGAQHFNELMMEGELVTYDERVNISAY